jgi:catalase
MSEPEQRHIASAFAFELGKVETVAIRRRMLGHLAIIDEDLCRRVERKLGMEGQADAIEPARPPVDLEASPSLSLVRKAKKTLEGRKVGVLVSDGADRTLLDRLRTAVEKEGGEVEVVAPAIGGASGTNGKKIAADHALAAAPSIFFDAVAVLVADRGAQRLAAHAPAVDWIRDAFAHLKAIGHVAAAAPLLERAGIEIDRGVVAIDSGRDLGPFLAAAREQRVWDRERRIDEGSQPEAAGSNGRRSSRRPPAPARGRERNRTGSPAPRPT